jgi:16S rRNA (cytidine1402-2'-O)-methyltransferase
MTSHREGTPEKAGTLYVVATPIGNLGDIAPRALDALRSVALVAAEDTRLTGHLLAHFGIETRLVAVHEHNERSAAPRVLEALARGVSVALVTDAGTPAISDPGAWIVAEARRAGYVVSPIPGPCAAAAAMSVSGGLAGRFLFHGFLPSRGSQRRTELGKLASVPCTLVFYEAPHRVRETVADLLAELGGGRRVLIARELTKLHEQIFEGTLDEAADWLSGDANRVRGEFVLLVEGAPESAGAEADRAAERLLAELLDELPLSRAVAVTARITGARRGDLYGKALALGRGGEAGPEAAVADDTGADAVAGTDDARHPADETAPDDADTG